MRRWIAFSLRHPSIVLLAAGLLLAGAGSQLGRMPVDVFPELNAPTVAVLTEAGGRSAEEVESLVTFPIEASMSGLPGIRRVRSASTAGLSIVWVEFEWGEDIYRARQLVAEKLATVQGELPPDTHPEIGPVASILGEILLVSLRSPGGTVSDLELRALAEYELRTRLLAVPGVAQVVVIGGHLPEYAVEVDPNRLLLYELTLEEVVRAAGEANATLSAGYLQDVRGREISLRPTGQVRSLEDLRDTVITFEHDTPVTLGDVADVRFTGALRRGAASENGTEAVVLSVQKSPGANTLELTRRIDGVLGEVENRLPADVELNRRAFRQADFIEAAVGNVVEKLGVAAAVTALVLVLFLLDVRATLITLVALPLSIAAALVAMRGLGLTVNVMTLGGLAIAIGELVDDAIIDVENVVRRMRENRALPAGERRSTHAVIYEASNEIRSSVVFATLIIVLVFVPLLFLSGLEGRFFRPMGITYIVSILASLVVAMTVTPALCRVILRGQVGGASRKSRVVSWLERLYRPALGWALRRRHAVAGAALVLTLGAVALGTTFGSSFLPRFHEGTLTVFLMAPPGTSLEASGRVARSVERELATIPGVRSVVRRTGRAERDEHAEPVSNSEIEVNVVAGAERDAVRRGVDRVLARVPGITTMVGQPIEHRLSHVLSGTPAAIAVDVFGDDLPELRAAASEIVDALRGLRGARDVAAGRELLVETLPIRYRSDELRRFGLTPEHAARQVSTGFLGTIADTVSDGVRRFDIVVRLAPEHRDDPQDVRRFLLHGAGGQRVRLEEVADIGPERVSNLIARQDVQRKVTVSCNVAEGTNLGHLVERVRDVVDPITERRGLAVRYGGQFEAQQAASRTLLWLMGAVVLVIFAMLHSAFGSMGAALVVLVNLPLALIGGVVAIFLVESPGVLGNLLALFGLSSRSYVAPVVSVASLVGFVTLFGVAVRNGILLVHRYQQLEREGLDVEAAVRRGSTERLAPILMTTTTAALALVPVAAAGEKPGGELLAPLAVVVLGGLVSSTILNLIVVPAGYRLIFDRQSSTTRARERELLAGSHGGES